MNMVDYEKIGARIQEQRKKIYHISQNKMAEDLGMYQADISNLEKAKSGSGISDLYKLDMIADYFHMPLQSLIFGGNEHMPEYTGTKMQLKRASRTPDRIHLKQLEKITGQKFLPSFKPNTFECGPYTIYLLVEYLQEFSAAGGDSDKPFTVPRLHFYTFYMGELIANIAVFHTTVMQHIFRPVYERIRSFIQPDIIDTEDLVRILNPYLMIHKMSEERDEELLKKIGERMDALRRAGEERAVLYIENAYVRNEYRKKGIFRMNMDLMKRCFPGCILWLNMLPPADDEMNGPRFMMSALYRSADVGQLNINAAIAEKSGFVIDQKIWMCPTKIIDAAGRERLELTECRKCACFLPEEIRSIVAEDDYLNSLILSMQNMQEESDDPGVIEDVRTGIIDGWKTIEFSETCLAGPCKGVCLYYIAAASTEDPSRQLFMVTKESAFSAGLQQEFAIETCHTEDEVCSSEYCEKLLPAMEMLLFDEAN